jgi:hypothetical protein
LAYKARQLIKNEKTTVEITPKHDWGQNRGQNHF